MKTKTPELDKLVLVSDKSQPIGSFLDWLTGEKGYSICELGENDRYNPVNTNIEKLLAEYFEIDLNKCEDERRALLEEIRRGKK